MASVNPKLNCSTLTYYCPWWQACVYCSPDKISITNDWVWVAGSTATVETEEVYIDGMITYISVDSRLEVWGSEDPQGIFIELSVIDSSGNSVFSRIESPVGYGYTDVTITFNVNIKVSGKVRVRYTISEKSAYGKPTRSYSSPIIYYQTEQQVPPPTPQPPVKPITANLTVKVTKDGIPVENASVIVLSKVVKPYPDYYTAKTDSNGFAVLQIPEGHYLVLADNRESFLDYRDDVFVTKDTSISLSLREKREARFALKLYLTVDASQYVTPIVDAVAKITEPFISVAGSMLSFFGINMSAYELLNHFTVEKIEATGPREVTIYIKYIGSPIPAAVIVAALIFATAVVVFVIGPIVFKWAFGEVGGAIAFVAVVAAVALLLAIVISSR
jgi:hypothetical protein